MDPPFPERSAPIIRFQEGRSTVSGLDHDGLSLYRALSRQLYGDPSNYTFVLKAVQDHFLRVWLDPLNQLHESYQQYVSRWDRSSPVSTFFGSLSCPDLITGEWTLTVIANALDVSIVIWDQVPVPRAPPPRQVAKVGPVSFPEVHILRTTSNTSSEHSIYHHDSLLEDESGYALIDFMTRQKSRKDLDIKEIIWWDDGGDDINRRFRCWNEYRGNHNRPLSNQLTKALCVFSISVSASEQVEPALKLLNDALSRAPAQETRVWRRNGRSIKPLKRYVGFDAEFYHFSQANSNDRLNARLGSETFEEVLRGKTESLCSVLTIAVDRHVVFSFHVLHMLQHATKHTADHLYKLFAETIFNDQLLKLWFNYQSDIAVLEATIAHMYQGTPRIPQILRNSHSNDEGKWVRYNWKFSSEHLRQERPAKLTFLTHNDDCNMHQKYPDNESQSSLQLSNADGQRIGCPCYLGNIDISPLLDYISRQLQWRGDSTPNYPPPPADDDDMKPWNWNATTGARYWKANRIYCSYGNFLRWTMGSDPLYPLFERLKSIPDGKRDKTAWFNTFGPGMEIDDEKMGYNIGDVVGIALLMRFLTTTDDRKMYYVRLADRLSHYSFAKPLCDTEATRPRVRSGLNPSNTNIPLFEDYPRMWKRDVIGNLQLPGHWDPFGLEFSGLAEVDTQSLNYHEHEERAVEGQSAIKYVKENSGKGDREELTKRILLRAHQKLFDPTKFELPAIFMTEVPQHLTSQPVNCKAIVRAGTSHTADLVEMVWKYTKDDPNREINPPPGYLERPGTPLGLPEWIGRVPGSDLGAYLKAAFKETTQSGPPGSPEPGSITGAPPRRQPPRVPKDNNWKRDIFDPHGIEYLRNLRRPPQPAPEPKSPTPERDFRRESSEFWAGGPPSIKSPTSSSQQTQQSGRNSTRSTGLAPPSPAGLSSPPTTNRELRAFSTPRRRPIPLTKSSHKASQSDVHQHSGRKPRKNSMVHFDRMELRKRKRVRDSEDRIGCVLERAVKTARWSHESEAGSSKR